MILTNRAYYEVLSLLCFKPIPPPTKVQTQALIHILTQASPSFHVIIFLLITDLLFWYKMFYFIYSHLFPFPAILIFFSCFLNFLNYWGRINNSSFNIGISYINSQTWYKIAFGGGNKNFFKKVSLLPPPFSETRISHLEHSAWKDYMCMCICL